MQRSAAFHKEVDRIVQSLRKGTRTGFDPPSLTRKTVENTAMTSARRLTLVLVLALLGALHTYGRAEMVVVPRYKTLELVFNQATTTPTNPFDTYLLRLELTDPDGHTFEIDGFYDGNGLGGQEGNTWKARISPGTEGVWTWRTVTGDAPDSGLAGLSGQFQVTESDDFGGVIANGRYFRYQNVPAHLTSWVTSSILPTGCIQHMSS